MAHGIRQPPSGHPALRFASGHYRRRHLCRVQNFYREHFVGHSANKTFAECSTRQNLFCLVPYPRQRQTLGKAPSAANDSKRSLAFRVSVSRTLGKCVICQALFLGTQQNIFIYFPLSTQTFSIVILYYLELHMQVWHITRIVCYI
jgi:hypothetical protein